MGVGAKATPTDTTELICSCTLHRGVAAGGREYLMKKQSTSMQAQCYLSVKLTPACWGRHAIV